MKKPFLIKLLCIVISIAVCILPGCKKIHQHTYIPTVTHATCEDQGFTTFTCECGVYYVSNYVDELPHTFNAESTCSTCGIYNYELAFAHEGNVITGLTEHGKTLSHLEVPRTIDGEQISYIGENAFAFSNNIESIVLPRTLTFVGLNAFRNCVNMKSIFIPSTMIVISNYAFKDCSALTIYYENETWPNGWGQHWNYSNCPVQKGYKYTTINGVIYGIKNGIAEVVKQPISTSSATVLESITYKGKDYAVTKLANYAFYKCNALESIVIPSRITNIGLSAFEGCYNLETIVIPSSVATIEENAFKGCVTLTINCQATEKPNGWHVNYNPSSCPVVWGYSAN